MGLRARPPLRARSVIPIRVAATDLPMRKYRPIWECRELQVENHRWRLCFGSASFYTVGPWVVASGSGSQFVEVDSRSTMHRPMHLTIRSTAPQSCRYKARWSRTCPRAFIRISAWPPRRQLHFVLSGTLEVETSDGKKRQCSGGSVFLADDVGTGGHRTRTIGGPARVLFVHLPPEANLRATRAEFTDLPALGSSQNRQGDELLKRVTRQTPPLAHGRRSALPAERSPPARCRCWRRIAAEQRYGRSHEILPRIERRSAVFVASRLDRRPRW
jgi:hypothetical protein